MDSAAAMDEGGGNPALKSPEAGPGEAMLPSATSPAKPSDDHGVNLLHSPPLTYIHPLPRSNDREEANQSNESLLSLPSIQPLHQFNELHSSSSANQLLPAPTDEMQLSTGFPSVQPSNDSLPTLLIVGKCTCDFVKCEQN